MDQMTLVEQHILKQGHPSNHNHRLIQKGNK